MTNKSDNHDQKKKTDNADTQTSGNTENQTDAENQASVEATSIDAETPLIEEKSTDTKDDDNKPSVWPARAAIVIALAALGLSGYLFMQQQTLHSDTVRLSAEVDTRLANNAAEVARTVSNVSEQSSSVHQQLGQLKEQTAASQRNVETLHERITQSIQQVQAQQTISDKDWLLAEAEYLLRLANQRILMEQNATGALALLRSADEVLLKADDVALYPVREALSKDISALESVPRIDAEGVFLRLSGLSSQVPNLRMTPITDRYSLPDLMDDFTPETVRETWGAGAREALSGAMQKLEQMVVIQHRDEPIQPLLSPEQNYYLQQNLHLMFEQAQHALLQRRQAAYENSLEKASNWVTSYFQASDATTLALLEGINALKQVQVAADVPSINGSLTALQHHINELRRLKREGGQG